jgi:hypothetical protein
VLVVTEQAGLNSVVIEQAFGGAGILAGDPLGFFQDADRPVSDVLKIADGRRNYVEAARNSRSYRSARAIVSSTTAVLASA